jgi:hypothetical protein
MKDELIIKSIKQILLDKEVIPVRQLELKWKSFMDEYPMTFLQIIDSDDIDVEFIASMLIKNKEVKNGNISMEKAEIDIGDQLANKYIYDTISKPTDEEFKEAYKKAFKNQI